MKQVFKYMMAAVMVAATLGLTGCKKDDNGNKDNATTPDTNRPDIALHYNAPTGDNVLNGDTLQYTATPQDLEAPFVALNLYIENQTSSDLSVSHAYEVLEGPEGMVTSECYNGSCPGVELPYTVAPGVHEFPYTIEAHMDPSYAGKKILYKVTVGKGESLADPMTIYWRIIM